MAKRIERNKFDAKQWYFSHFKLFENSLNGDVDDSFHALRKQAIQTFFDLGFPTTRDEDWKYTNVAPLLQHKYTLDKPSTVSFEVIKNFVYEGLENNLIVFVNGLYSEQLSNIKTPASGLIVESLQTAFKTHSDIIGKHLGRYAGFQEESFTALNTAFTHEGVFVYVPQETQFETPVQIIYLSDSTDNVFVSHPRNLIIAEAGSAAKIVESFCGFGQHPYFNNIVTEVAVAENAVVDHIKVQEECPGALHIANTHIHQEANSLYTSVNIDFGAAMVRNNLNVSLNAENCESHLFGFYIGKKNQHIDNHTFIDHAKPHCFSNELYKGILDDHATGVFNGKILVRPDAQKTSSLQSNKTLLLTNDAAINAKPQLEIFADDVKCTHGATIGQLDDEALFYLRARGIGEDVAEAMLRYAFVADVFQNIKIDSVHKKLDAEMMARLMPADEE